MSEQQRRGRRIAMTEQEQDAFLRAERTCRVATTSELGPHNAPLWFWWDGSHVWLKPASGGASGTPKEPLPAREAACA